MEGIYIGAMGMLSSQNHIDTHANNIANANSNGFKFDTMMSKVFEEKSAYRNEGGARTFIGDYSNKVVDEGIITNLRPGQTKITNSPLDVTVNDKPNGNVSFFVVSKDNKQYLTRNGEFELDDERKLRTMSGAYILDSNNKKITVPKGVNPMIDKEGNVRNNETGDLLGKIQMRAISQNNRPNLNKEEGTMFSYMGGINQLPISQSEVQSNMLELSNVDMSKEMVDLLNSQKSFQANQRAFLSYDKVLDKEANQLIR
ncbi:MULTISPECIES: flagellar hook-basal body complex protein [Bacillus cereus group]|uniref:flagellar hook-basal body complex protein n=1 Tax=Bacillus cereus group TaxID=86661 RepID=UPI0022E53769|nr:flagellar hook-basal body complex protein [Bacillus cereus group sp. TH152-1LC]MDA1674924.1 flagellar hook-basal body complex protein [Bacillus cereus group sp. TH152-1LC]